MNQEEIGKKIKQIRIDNNLTQREFSDILGVTYQAVSKWENGKNLPDISIMKDICDKYNYKLDELLGNSYKAKKNNKLKYVIIAIIIVIFLSVLFLIIKHTNNFHFGTINTSCPEFKITGSIAYNSNKTSIYISDLKYCGDSKDNTIYKRIESTLLISKNNVDRNIYTDTKENMTLDDYLDNFSIQVNSNICLTFDGDLSLSIYAYDSNDKATIYRIPLSMSDSCSIK
ncbi:MAG: helix-turn-helix transcriptional regulator [Bacilli bacterium]|nr:helix-turn-helix transcriptional regulator [Bacilli bacterium]